MSLNPLLQPRAPTSSNEVGGYQHRVGLEGHLEGGGFIRSVLALAIRKGNRRTRARSSEGLYFFQVSSSCPPTDPS